MDPHYLEQLYCQLGHPRWFWPVVLLAILGLLVLAGSLTTND